MTGIFYAYDTNANEVIINTRDIVISPSGRNLTVALHPEKGLAQGDNQPHYENYRAVLARIPNTGKREEFKNLCEKALADYNKNKLKEKRKIAQGRKVKQSLV